MTKFLLALAGAFFATAGFAQTVEDARTAYQTGDYELAMQIAIPAANGGDRVAQNLVGAAFNDGNGVEKNIETSIEWFKKSADQNFTKAMYNLGLAYRNDVNPPDYAQSIKYFEMAMKDDYPSAFTQRGEMYALGQGSDVLPKQARVVLHRAAALSDPDGMAILADLYRTGQGGDVDYKTARAFYSEAASLGHAKSMGNLALMYEQGLGVEEDAVTAYALFVEAVEQGDANSAVNLANFMMEFDGYWYDASIAYAYCLLAYRLDEIETQQPRFDQVCDGIKSQLTPKELSAANANFQSW